jgi:hypothetical protein
LSNTFDFIRAKSAGLDLVKRTYGSLFKQMEAMGKTNIDLAANLKETAKETVDLTDSFNQVRENLDFLADIPIPPSNLEKIFEGLGKIKTGVVKGVGTVFKVMKGIGGGVASGITAFLEVINKFVPIFDVLNGLVEIFGGAVSEALMPAFQEFTELLMDPAIIEMITLLGEAFGQILAVGLRLLSGVLKALIDSGVLDFIIDGLQMLTVGLTFLADSVSILFDPAFWEALGNVLVEWGDSIADAWNAFWADFAAGAAEWWTGIVNGWNEFWSGIADGAMQWWNQITGFFTMLWDLIIGGIKFLINGVVFVINAVIDGLNALDFADVFPDIQRIPMLAEGVPMVTSPTLAIVGERGPEGVFPINDRGAAMAAAVFGGGTTNNNRSVTTNVQATVFGEEQMEELTRRVYVENVLNGRR